jgi:hypothetical protein
MTRERDLRHPPFSARALLLSAHGPLGNPSDHQKMFTEVLEHIGAVGVDFFCDEACPYLILRATFMASDTYVS